MKIKLKDEVDFRNKLNEIKDITNKLLGMNLTEQELTSESIAYFKEIQNSILRIHYINLTNGKIQIISSDGAEPINII